MGDVLWNQAGDRWRYGLASRLSVMGRSGSCTRHNVDRVKECQALIASPDKGRPRFMKGYPRYRNNPYVLYAKALKTVIGVAFLSDRGPSDRDHILGFAAPLVEHASHIGKIVDVAFS